jgi:hypothetical protein
MEAVEVNEEAVAPLHLLLAPRPPRIFSARRAPRPRPTATPPEPAVPTPRAPKSPKIGSEAAPGEIPYRNPIERNKNVQKLAQQSQMLARVRNVQDTTSSMQDKITAYARSWAVKRTIHEQEYQDRFSIPLQYRIRDHLTPEKHHKFVKEKNAAIEIMDEKPIPIRSDRALPKIPIVSVSKRGLHDPTYKYIEHQQKENKLSDFLARSNGEEIKKPSKVKERLVDYGRMAYEHQTRFYWGAIPQADEIGRKAFDEHNESKVGRALDMFGGPRPEGSG